MQFLKPEAWPRAPGFSWGVAAAGRSVYVAGQIGRDLAADGPVCEGFAAQTAMAFRNLKTVLAEAGAGPEHIAHMTWYVTDLDAYKRAGRDIGSAYREILGKHFPSMTMVQVVGLLHADALVEIECFAVVPQDAEAVKDL